MMNDRNGGLSYLGSLAAIALLLVVTAPAMAAPCTESGSRGPIDIVVPKMVVARDAPVGTVLAKVVSAKSSYRVECSGPRNFLQASLGQRMHGNVMEVVDQNGWTIPGLGVRLKMSSNIVRGGDGRCIGAGEPLRGRQQFGCWMYITFEHGPDGGSFGYGTLTLTFIKTSPALVSARLGAQTMLSLRMDNYTAIAYRITGGEVAANPCTFDIPRNVSLGIMSAAAMNDGQSHPPVNFQMRVNCASSAKYSVKFRPSGGSMPVGGMPGAISNSAAAGVAAKNVHVQIQDAFGSPVSLNTAINHGAQQAASVVSYQARMVRDAAAPVEPGMVAAAVEVSFNFD